MFFIRGLLHSWYEQIFLPFSLTGLSPKEYRCKISNCDGDNSTVFEFGDIFEHDLNGKIDYCKSLVALSNSTQSQCSFVEGQYESCKPSGGNQMIYSKLV